MLVDFLNALFNGQPLRLGPPAALDADDIAAASQLLSQFERQYRLELPGVPPRFDSEAALWSATSLYLAASVVVHRDVGLEMIEEKRDESIPDSTRAESHYAVDLTMRFLPELWKLAKGVAADDPLVQRLLVWGRQWPLSSVGVRGVGNVDITPLRTSPTLLRLYVDRILAASDAARLNDPAVAAAVRFALGDHPSLSPAIAAALQESASDGISKPSTAAM